ncbi:hypothetical protein C474_16034 [Halogeometricum pallidum JCM 14848]|uniref:Transcriptional regulator n=1 Tax=Halogeometricum pallidum JCM 14848 TaxID=1227487 RepID=M0CXT5_HALPD|nr:DUF5821 family protein [Halogeometricum pallidum]ELZ28026.1 hypothetical protein C474_16034 [Halogeometricum pallidum JCM 14848]
MNHPAELLTDEMSEVFEWAFETTEESLYLVNPTAETLERAVESLSMLAGLTPTVRVLGEKAVLREVMNDFLVASRTADLVESETLELRVLDDTDGYKPNLMASESVVTTVVSADSLLAGLRTDDEEFVGAVYEEYEALFEESDDYALRTPGLSRVETTIADRLGPECRTDFTELLSNLQTARGDSDGPDEVAISLLVAARNGELFYDVSRWAEEIGLASKATFSRKKGKLEEQGLIVTEKVPIDVGRPRLRLKLGDERLKEASGAQLASIAQSAGS